MNTPYYTALNIIRNQKTYNRETCAWEPFDEEERERAFQDLKGFVSATARGKRRERIFYGYMYNVKEWGILGRLWWYPDTGKVEYCCGQEWNSEMAVLRDAFDWKVRK